MFFRFKLLLNKLFNNRSHLFILISFIGGILLSLKNNSNFSMEFNKIYNKLISFENFIKNLINNSK